MGKTVVIMRGPSGSGKSTRAFNRAYAAGMLGLQTCTVSADHFFEKGGRYEFSGAKLPQAHAECLGRFLDALLEGCDLVIVDNTNTQVWELLTYAKVALIAGYDIEVDEPPAMDPASVAAWAARNVHGVPQEKVRAMATRWEAFDVGAFKKEHGR